LLNSCSVFKGKEIGINNEFDNAFNKVTPEIVKNNNITNSSFFISKAEVEILDDHKTVRIRISLKYIYPEKYLLSIRNLTGIEVARIFISGDSVLINDRLNRQLLYGSNKDIAVKYGFDIDFIPVILGDLAKGHCSIRREESCIKGLFETTCSLEDVNINYIIDCNKLKVISAFAKNSRNKNTISLKFSEFKKIGKLILPEEIRVEEKERMLDMIIKIKNIQLPWDGTFNFYPEAKYEMIPIL
jgi:hypothetical protein